MQISLLAIPALPYKTRIEHILGRPLTPFTATEVRS